ncbi:organic cation transporter protein-like [Lineus longissimus]|uniref:organic cation transporter protein-like n=1 Tax=Lineus longissimus TaxID=88925 RepID=UPI00315CD1B1
MTPETSGMDIDMILRHLKPYGRLQIIQVLVGGILFKFFASMTFVSTVFIGWIPPHHCTIPANATLTETLPGEYIDGVFIPDNCLMYDSLDRNRTVPCTDGWTYQADGWWTIVTQWDLVCDRDFVSDFSQSLNAVGLLFGSLIFATISDLFGRKKTVLVTTLLLCVFGVGTGFTPNVYWYSAMRVIAGALLTGIGLSSYVLVTEIFPVAQRSFGTNLIWIVGLLGQLSMTLLAYYIKDWRYFQMAMNAPLIANIAGFWIFHETIPWLLAKKRGKEAARVFGRVAKFNKVAAPPEIIKKLEAETGEGEELSVAEQLKELLPCCKAEQSEDEIGIKVIFQNTKLRMFTIMICVAWFMNVFIFYGLTLSTASFPGNRFVNYALSILVELPAYSSCIYILRRFGRRIPLMVFYITAGVSLFFTGFVPDKTASGIDLTGLIIALNTIGKYCISSAFSGIYLYTGELFPTRVRNRAMGLASAVSRVGAVLAPFSVYLSRYYSWLVGVIFGVLSILTSLLFISLPETGNASMPQTMEEVERMAEKKTEEE